MVENDFKALAHKVVENWRDEQTSLNAGATEDELQAFEKRVALTLPPDFRYFYSLVNGMADDMDNCLFSLWPLERIASVMERSRSHSEERDEETRVEDRGNLVCSSIFNLFRDLFVAKKKSHPVERVRQPLTNCKIEIAFGDYLADSYRYLLCQDEEGQFFVHWDGGERLADCFSHFLQRYSTEPEQIYLFFERRA
jgi:SMI1 / KNR4 family (SUKH-1)